MAGGRSKQRAREELMGAMRASATASQALDHAVADLLGVNRTDMRIMDLLDQTPDGRLTAGELAEGAALSSAAITTAVDRLERGGHVRRVRDDRDRRRVFVELDPERRAAGHDDYRQVMLDGEKLLSRYTIAELELIRDFLVARTELTRHHAGRLRDAGKEN